MCCVSNKELSVGSRGTIQHLASPRAVWASSPHPHTALLSIAAGYCSGSLKQEARYLITFCGDSTHCELESGDFLVLGKPMTRVRSLVT